MMAMAAQHRRTAGRHGNREREADSAAGRGRRALALFLVVVAGVLALVLFLNTSRAAAPLSRPFSSLEASRIGAPTGGKSGRRVRPAGLPEQSEMSLSLSDRNRLPARNADLFPKLAPGHITIVLYVHNRPQYLSVVLRSLSQVEGISETLLIVSHDGYFPQMDSLVQSVRFCRVKQLYAPFSPHLFPSSFPGVSPDDCSEKANSTLLRCNGDADQYGHHRSPKIVSLKHHWWWMMNTVWDGLDETQGSDGHILFIEEDHFIFPNAYRTIQLLASLKPNKCLQCYAVNLAPFDVFSKGEGTESLIAEKVGNVGYAFNRTVWRMIHAKASEFCSFDDYNWDITMWATVYPSFGPSVYTLRGPRRSAAHFGKCGLHQGQGGNTECNDKGEPVFDLEDTDRVLNINRDWPVRFIERQSKYKAGFSGWGGWGDRRDRKMCMSFAQMYQ